MQYAICTVAAAPLRKEPSHRAEMTSQLLFGESVEIVEEKEEWFRVRCLYDGYEAWAMHHLIQAVDAAVAKAPLSFVTTHLINPVRYKDAIFQIPMGCSLPGLDESTRRLWQQDYHYRGDYRRATAPHTAELFQNTIEPWLHAPYLWGGKTFMGVDCSGFVQTVFKVLGVPLLRDAYQQAEQGAAVNTFEAIREGDVAFFKNEAGRIIHVGIVLSGNTIIHASGTVRIDCLTPDGIFKADEGAQSHVFHSVKRFITLAG